jgi:hypothetical protein
MTWFHEAKLGMFALSRFRQIEPTGTRFAPRADLESGNVLQRDLTHPLPRTAARHKIGKTRVGYLVEEFEEDILKALHTLTYEATDRQRIVNLRGPFRLGRMRHLLFDFLAAFRNESGLLEDLPRRRTCLSETDTRPDGRNGRACGRKAAEPCTRRDGSRRTHPLHNRDPQALYAELLERKREELITVLDWTVI